MAVGAVVAVAGAGVFVSTGTGDAVAVAASTVAVARGRWSAVGALGQHEAMAALRRGWRRRREAPRRSGD